MYSLLQILEPVVIKCATRLNIQQDRKLTYKRNFEPRLRNHRYIEMWSGGTQRQSRRFGKEKSLFYVQEL